MRIDNDINSMYPWYTSIGLMQSQQNREHLMRVLNKKYWPVHITVGPTKIADAERWCYANLKSSEWRNVGTYFAFKQEQDSIMFSLKWS